MREVLLVDQDRPVLGRQHKAPLAICADRRRQEPRDGLLLEPLAAVALVDLRRYGEVARCQLGTVEQLVQPEPPAEVDAEQLERAEG